MNQNEVVEFLVNEEEFKHYRNLTNSYAYQTRDLFHKFNMVRNALNVRALTNAEYPYIPNHDSSSIAMYIKDILKPKKTDKIIDIGCGASPLLYCLNLMGFDRNNLFGLDLDIFWEDYNYYFNPIKGDLRTFSIEEYQIIYFYHPLTGSMKQEFFNMLKTAKKGTRFVLHPMEVDQLVKQLPKTIQTKVEAKRIQVVGKQSLYRYDYFIDVKIIK